MHIFAFPLVAIAIAAPLVAYANIEKVPVGAISHCIDSQSYCLETPGNASKYFVTNTPDVNAYGACENEHDGHYAGQCVFYNKNGLAYQAIRVGCKGRKSWCVATLGDVSTDPNDAGATRFQCFGHAKAAWTGEGDDTSAKGAEAGVVFAKAKGDNLVVECPHAQTHT